MGINGFGRIGRLVFRAASGNPDAEVEMSGEKGACHRPPLVLSESELKHMDGFKRSCLQGFMFFFQYLYVSLPDGNH